MRVVIYTGSFQYDVVNDFAFSIGEVLTSSGIEVDIIDLNSKDLVSDLQRVFSLPVDFVLSFNGIGTSLRLGEESLYDALNVPFVIWLVDHPVYLIDRIREPIKQKIIVCIDESHCDYIENNIEDEIIVTFIPHAATAGFLSENEERRYDVVFAGHIKSEEVILNEFYALPEQIRGIKTILDRRLEYENNVNLLELVEEIKYSSPLFKEVVENNIKFEATLIQILDKYLRETKRNKVLRKLLDVGIKIDFFGVISEGHSFLQHPNFKFHGAVPFNEMKQIFQSSKAVINIMPNFISGGHERIYTSMAFGAIPITDSNNYLMRNFTEGFIILDYLDISTTVPEINKIITDDSYRKQLQIYNHQVLQQNHTWHNRVSELMYVVNEAKRHFQSVKVI